MFTAVCPQPLSRGPRGMEPVCPLGAGAGFNLFCASAPPNAIEREKQPQLLPITIILSPMHTQKKCIAACLYFHHWRATSTCKLYLGYIKPRAPVTLRNALYQGNWGRLKAETVFFGEKRSCKLHQFAAKVLFSLLEALWLVLIKMVGWEGRGEIASG